MFPTALAAPGAPAIAATSPYVATRAEADVAAAEARLEQARTMDDLERAFPYSILTANCEIEPFYAFYGLG